MTEEETLDSPPETQSELPVPESVPSDDGPDALEAAKLQRRTKLWRLFFIAVLVVFVFAQKQFVEGLAQTGLKG